MGVSSSIAPMTLAVAPAFRPVRQYTEGEPVSEQRAWGILRCGEEPEGRRVDPASARGGGQAWLNGRGNQKAIRPGRTTIEPAGLGDRWFSEGLKLLRRARRRAMSRRTVRY